MLKAVQSYVDDFTRLFFPHYCVGCGSDLLELQHFLCAQCFSKLPPTDFFILPGNALERKLYGRVNCAHAGSAFYFSKDSILQHLVYELKYKGNKAAGIFLGKLMGHQLSATSWIGEIDLVIPLPLNAKKEKMRGFNQVEILVLGLTEVIKKRVVDNAVTRTVFTESQTHKDRVERWQNMDGVFFVKNPQALEGKHILLVDDVITTGATMEACGQAILNIPQTTLSIATAAYAM